MFFCNVVGSTAFASPARGQQADRRRTQGSHRRTPRGQEEGTGSATAREDGRSRPQDKKRTGEHPDTGFRSVAKDGQGVFRENLNGKLFEEQEDKRSTQRTVLATAAKGQQQDKRRTRPGH